MNSTILAQNNLTVQKFEAALARQIQPLRDGMTETRRDISELSSLLNTVIESRGLHETSSEATQRDP